MIKIGLIGAGKFAEAHVHALSGLTSRAKLAAYARKDSDKAFPAAGAHGAVQMPLEELIASPDIDAVIICAPNHLHRTYAEAALRAGKHVFCEKPLALTLKDADAAIESADTSRRVLMVGHLTRHVPLYVRVAEIIEAGDIGAPFAVYAQRMHCRPEHSWRMDPEIGGGAVFDLLVHDFDLVNWFLGDPHSVVARGRRHEQGAYDYVAAIFGCKNECTAVVEGGFVLRPPAGLRSFLRVVGERGHIEVDTTELETPIQVFCENETARSVSVPMQNILIESVQSELTEFLDTIEGTAANRLKLENARTAVACASAVIAAADSGVKVGIVA